MTPTIFDIPPLSFEEGQGERLLEEWERKKLVKLAEKYNFKVVQMTEDKGKVIV